MIYLLISVGSLAVAGYLAALRSGNSRALALLKPIPVLCMLVGLWPLPSNYAFLIGLGLVFSLIGDLLLIGSSWFTFGLISFLIAHLAYIAAYLSVNADLQIGLVLPVALYGFVMGRRLWPNTGGMRWPVLLYIVVICVMVWRAATLVSVSGLKIEPSRGWWALSGAILFALSDSLLAFDRFIRPIRYARYVIMLSYWAGQLGIVLSVR